MTSVLDRYRVQEAEEAHKPKTSAKSTKSLLEKYRQKEDVSSGKDIIQQIPLGALEGGTGAYGDILEAIHANPKESLLPSQKLAVQKEATGTDLDIANSVSDTIAQEGSGRLPTSEEIGKLFEMLGASKPQTSAGRIAKKGAKAAGGATALGIGPVQTALAAGGGVTGQSIREVGGPEWLAELSDVVVNLSGLLKNIPKTVAKKAATSESGLIERKFEKLTKPTKVTQGTKAAVGEKIGKEFKDISEELLTSTNKSLRGFREDPTFQTKLSAGYESLKETGRKIPKEINAYPYQKSLSEEYRKIGQKGFELTEAEKAAQKVLKKSISEARNKEITFTDLVDQYQKNNAEVSKYLPYGEHAVANEGKREALLAKNRAIKSVIESEFKDFPEAKDFDFLNKRWSEVQKIKTVDSFVDSVFKDGKIDFKQVQKVLSGGKKSQALENAVGKEQFNRFKQLNKDLMTKEQAYKMLKDKGYTVEDLMKAGKRALLKPGLGKAHIALETVKQVWRKGLSDPKYTRDWSNAVKLFNKGRVEEAIAIMNSLEKEDEED